MIRKFGRIKKIFKAGKKVCSEGAANLTCLEYKDENMFIAHCLEFDLAAEGKTENAARTNLAELIKSHIDFAIEKDVEDKSLFHPAPSKYWDILYHVKAKMARQVLLKAKDISIRAILDRMDCTYAHI